MRTKVFFIYLLDVLFISTVLTELNISAFLKKYMKNKRHIRPGYKYIGKHACGQKRSSTENIYLYFPVCGNNLSNNLIIFFFLPEKIDFYKTMIFHIYHVE